MAADLAAEDWPPALTAGGFDHAARTVFIVEGLSWYLTEEENARLLDDLARLAVHGWQAEVTALDAFARRLGRWPPPEVPEDIAARAVASGRNTVHARETRSASVLLH